MNGPPCRLLVFIVAYQAESTIFDVLRRIPALEEYDVEILLIDDGSKDRTFDLADHIRRSGEIRHRLTVLANPVNLGYGGNQKVGYRYAIRQGFDLVALLHGDGQYAPEVLPALAAPIAAGQADVVLGSRLLIPRDALKGGMPLYKFAGNRALTWYQNRVLRSRLSEFHTGYRVYSTEALRRIPFEINSNVFHFDTEIIIQCLRAGCRIRELPIPTHYGNEICRVPGFRYAWNVICTSTIARLQEYGLVYRRVFDVRPDGAPPIRPVSRLSFASTYTVARRLIPSGARVLAVESASAELPRALEEGGCRVELRSAEALESGREPSLAPVDFVLLFDVLEQRRSPEVFLQAIRNAIQPNLEAKVILSAANLGYCVTRLMLLAGHFNYTREGILNLSHRRLFLRSSLRRVVEEAGFVVESVEGVPPPLPFAIKRPALRRLLMNVHGALTRFWPTLFAYQFVLVARPLPTVDTLLRRAEASSRLRAAALLEEPAGIR